MPKYQYKKVPFIDIMARQYLGKNNMDVITYKGNGQADHSITGLDFSPGLVWIKDRMNVVPVIFHVGLTGGTIFSDSDDAETSATYIESLDSNGFTLAGSLMNAAQQDYVAWCWNTGNDIQSIEEGGEFYQIQANPEAGVSVVTYTGNGSGPRSIPHGLNSAPTWMMIKGRSSSSQQWAVYTQALENHSLLPENYAGSLDSTLAYQSVGWWGNAVPTDTHFTVWGSGGPVNNDGDTYVAICFHDVPGYSKFGSYEGYGSFSSGGDDVSVYTGFRPRFVMIKESGGTDPWVVIDSERGAYGSTGPNNLAPSLNINDRTIESNDAPIIFTNTGFTILNGNAEINYLQNEYVYMAFAEQSFSKPKRVDLEFNDTQDFNEIIRGDTLTQYPSETSYGVVEEKDQTTSKVTVLGENLPSDFDTDGSEIMTKPVSDPSNKRWTWSGWVKRSEMGTEQAFFSSGTSRFFFNTDDRLCIVGGTEVDISTSEVFLDTVIWNHILVSSDTIGDSQGVKLYVNGNLVTDFETNTQPGFDYSWDFNTTGNTQYIGTDLSNQFSGYVAEIYFVDGQVFDPSEFTLTNRDRYDQLYPKSFDKWVGTRGYHLEFRNPSSDRTIGTNSESDFTYWNTSNIARYGRGEVESDLIKSVSLVSDGVFNIIFLSDLNLRLLSVDDTANQSDLSASGNVISVDVEANSITLSSNDNTWEVNGVNTVIFPENYQTDSDTTADVPNVYGIDSGLGYEVRGNYVTLDPLLSTASTLTNGNLTSDGSGTDLPNYIPGDGQWYYEIDGVGYNWDGTAANFTSSAGTYNFGATEFTGSAPTGYKTLNIQNIEDGLVVEPEVAFDVVTYTGNGSTQSITDLGFSPDLVWIKSRSAGDKHGWFDTTRGTGTYISSNDDNQRTNASDSLSSFDSNGFTLGSNTKFNGNERTYVAWCWNAGTGTASLNTSGSIATQVKSNPTYGFSIVEYLGTGNPESIGHGLGATPAFIISKCYTKSSENWSVWHQSLPVDQKTELNNTNETKEGDQYGEQTPTSTVFYTGPGNQINRIGESTISYCWSEIEGFSSFGSYSGDESEPFVVQTGFKPRWVMIKETNSSTPSTSWLIFDSERGTGTLSKDPYLAADLSSAESGVSTSVGGTEGVAELIDFTSNGFVPRVDVGTNSNGDSYIYMAFAEDPFQYLPK